MLVENKKLVKKYLAKNYRILDINELTFSQYLDLCPSPQEIYYLELEEKTGMSVNSMLLQSIELHLNGYFSKEKNHIPTSILDEFAKEERRQKKLEDFRKRKGLK